MASCKGCNKEIRWMDTFPGDICVDCHRDKMQGATAQQHYEQVMGGFANPGGNVVGPRKFKKSK